MSVFGLLHLLAATQMVPTLLLNTTFLHLSLLLLHTINLLLLLPSMLITSSLILMSAADSPRILTSI